MSRKRAKVKVTSESDLHCHGVELDERENARTHHHHQQLIPGLPDHIAHLILSKLPPSILFSVCLSWRKLIYCPLFPPFLSLYVILTSSNPNANSLNSSSSSSSYPISQSIVFSNFDPISSRWQWLPNPPLDLLLRHPSFISRNLAIQSVTAANRLVVVAATSERLSPALTRPLVFDPAQPGWRFGPDISVPRRWCATGSVRGVVYVASGVGTHFSTYTARLVERWDLTRLRGDGAWEKAKPLKDGRFAREAVDGVGWKGKLCMVNVDAKEGAVYDTQLDECFEMAEGMVAGWRGPAASMAEQVVYLVDQTKGVLRRYDEEGDLWVDVFECERFKGAQHIAAAGGKVCVVTGGGGGIFVVDVADAPVKTWVVEPPAGYKAVAVHVLPRMSRPEWSTV